MKNRVKNVESVFFITQYQSVSEMYFFSPKPFTYTSSPLDGMAKNDFISSWIRKIMQLSCLDPFNSYLLIPEERKKHLV